MDGKLIPLVSSCTVTRDIPNEQMARRAAPNRRIANRATNEILVESFDLVQYRNGLPFLNEKMRV